MITTGDKQNQKAGDNSQQLQANNMTVIVGIDEKRAREICEEMTLQLRKDYSEEALKIAISRVSEFENKLMPKMETINGALEVFGDPSFQLLLAEAQKAAASSERPADYELLAELLVHRFVKGENRIARAGISRAVEIVDKISDDALLALTAFHSMNSFIPNTGNIQQGLSILNDLFGKILYGNLPFNNEWLDHLEILNAIRITPFIANVSLENRYGQMLEGYVAVGIRKESENYKNAINILKDLNLPGETFVQHHFNDDYFRLNIANKDAINNLKFFHKPYYSVVPIQVELTADQKEKLELIYDLYEKDANVRQTNLKKMMNELSKFPHLKKLLDWNNKQNISFQITSVGEVLAHSNAQRCEKTLPSLD